MGLCFTQNQNINTMCFATNDLVAIHLYINDISDQMVINRKRVSPVLLMQSRKICLTELSEMETENNTPPDNH